jgi:UPF0716 family protein affecting phage T7 exclusion
MVPGDSSFMCKFLSLCFFLFWIDLFLLFKLSGQIGFFGVMLWVVGTAIIGPRLARAVRPAMPEEASSQSPLPSPDALVVMGEHAILFASSVLWFVPGLLLKGIAALLLIRPFRRALLKYMGKNFALSNMPAGAASQGWHTYTRGGTGPAGFPGAFGGMGAQPAGNDDPGVIAVRSRVVDEDPAPALPHESAPPSPDSTQPGPGGTGAPGAPRQS